MQIGLHFGKRKPRWNFFLEKHLSLKETHGTLLRLALMSMGIHAIILSPILYWSFQNYHFFETNIPMSYNLRHFLQAEKMWIVFLYGLSVLMAGAVNFFLFSRLTVKKHFSARREIALSPGEAADRRHAS